MQFANRNPQNHPTQGNSYHPQTSICRATHAWIYCVFSGSKKAGSRFAYTDRNLHRQNGVFMAISLSLDQKEKAKHGEQLFPLQRYITNLSSTYPAVTAHWHKEAEFTMITDGNCTYQIQLCPYPVNAGDLIFVPPLVLHSIHSNTDPAMTSETFVFHMNYLGMGNADICAVKYLTPLAMQKIIPPYIIKKEHPVYADALTIFHKISQLYHAKPIGYELRIKSLLLELIALLLPFCQEDSAFSQLSNEHTSKLKAVLEFIEQHYADPLSVADLASVCCFSEYHFMRFFKKYMGESAMEYVRNVRLAKAAELFEQGAQSSLEVSLSCGFNNLSYFHREFKEKYGMTPGAFQRKINV